jgi:phage gpG-like protein
MSATKNINPFDKWIPTYIAWRRKLPDEVSTIAVNEFKNNFRQGGWRQGSGTTKWKPLAKQKKGKKKGAVLVASGRLKRSLRKQPDFIYARVVTNVPYAKIHNEGGTISGTFQWRQHKRINKKGGYSTVKSHSKKVNTKIPARPFMEMGEGLKQISTPS